MRFKASQCKDAVCKNSQGDFCGQKIQTWQCMLQPKGVLAQISTQEHRSRATPLRKKESYHYSAILTTFMSDRIEKRPSEILKEVTESNQFNGAIPTLTSVQDKCANLRKKLGLTAANTLGSIIEELDLLMDCEDVYFFAENIQQPTEENAFTIGFSSPG
jgi:hypothetical protein